MKEMQLLTISYKLETCNPNIIWIPFVRILYRFWPKTIPIISIWAHVESDHCWFIPMQFQLKLSYISHSNNALQFQKIFGNVLLHMLMKWMIDEYMTRLKVPD